MPKLNILEVLNDPENERVLDPFAFEKYCGACDNFYDPVTGYKQTMFHECPFKGKVNEDTDWTLLNCKYFLD